MNLGSNWVNNANLRELDERKRGWGKTKSDKTHCKKKKNRSSRNHIAMSGKILKQDFFHLGSVLIT